MREVLKLHFLSRMAYYWEHTGDERIEKIPRKIVLSKSRKRGNVSVCAVTSSHSVKLVRLVIFGRHEAASLCNTIFATRGGRRPSEIAAAGYGFSMYSSLFFFLFFHPGILDEREISRAVARNFRSNGRNRRPRARDQDSLFAIDTLSMIASLISNVNRAFLRPGEYSRRRDGRQNYGERPLFAIFDRRYQQLATLLQLPSK